MTVLSGLLESPLGVLGEIAIARIRADDVTDERPREPIVDGITETLRRRGYRQLDTAESTIRSLIKRELELMMRLGFLAEQFGITRVAIAPAEGQAPPRGDGLDQLLSPVRMKLFEQFLKVWDEVARDLRLRWELTDGE